MLELIGLLSDKTVGKPNSCQPPSGSRETRKIPLGHKFQLARLFGKKLKHGYSYVFKSRTSLQLSSWLWLEDDSVICTRAASTVGPAACSTRLLLTARNTRLASRKSGKEIQIFLMMTSTWPYNQHLGFSLRINKLFFFFFPGGLHVTRGALNTPNRAVWPYSLIQSGSNYKNLHKKGENIKWASFIWTGSYWLLL